MKAVIYIRVSTTEQDYERQHSELLDLARRDNYDVVKIFEDKISGIVKGSSRKGFNDMLSFIQNNNIKQIYCWEISRIGRSLRDTINTIYKFDDEGINICTKKESLNTLSTDPTQQLLRNTLISLAEYELSSIKERTISGTYNSIRNGGAGGGSIKQYGYKKENNKLLINEEEAEVIRDICNRYLNKDMSLGQIAEYLNEIGVETRYKKLIDEGTITYKIASKHRWTDGSVARLLHKRLLTGYRKYGQVELNDEKLRIIDDQTFEAIQIKMNEKRKTIANAQKFENILRGVLTCGNCGGAMIMHKGTTGLQNHYKCFRRFVEKSDCTASMINIDLLNNQVYDLAKNFKVDSKDIIKKLTELQNSIDYNTTSINQIRLKIYDLSNEEDRLVDLYLSGGIKRDKYDVRLKKINSDQEEAKTQIAKLEDSINKIQSEINELTSKKIVDLKNPLVFKSNIKNLVESIEVKTLNEADLVEVNTMLSENYDGVYLGGINRRNKVYHVKIKMFDNKTIYNRIFNNVKPTSSYRVSVDKI